MSSCILKIAMTIPKIKRIQAVEVYRNRFGALYDDEVKAPDGTAGRYLRWQWQNPGVVIIPFDGTAVAFSQNFRYPADREMIELPRGFCRAGESSQDAAFRELEEEAGLSAREAAIIGNIFPDSGFIGSSVPVALLHVISREQSKQKTESMESIGNSLIWLNASGIDRYIREGHLQCGVTLAAILVLKSRGIL